MTGSQEGETVKHVDPGPGAVNCLERNVYLLVQDKISHPAGESRKHDSKRADTNALNLRDISAECPCMPTQNGYLGSRQNR